MRRLYRMYVCVCQTFGSLSAKLSGNKVTGTDLRNRQEGQTFCRFQVDD